MRIQTSKNKTLILKIFCLIGLFASTVSAQKPATTQATRTITVITEPNAIVWLDDLRRGTTDESGKLIIKPVTAGAHKLRVRADGFKETSQNLTAAQKDDVKIALVKTTDQAELTFQEAERLSTTDREKAIVAYRKAISLRPKYAEANLALARVLSASSDNEGALKAIAAAKKARLNYAEASAVEGRIYVSEGDEKKAIAAFKRAITEGKGFQPEAQTGLGLLYKDKAEAFGSTGDFESEEANYMLAVGYFKKAVSQLAGAPDAITIYQFLGLAFEKMKKFNEAIAVYEEFLRVFPDSNEATAVKSFIIQLKKQMSEKQ
ncbi:MAG: tetratricopeptide repeat protein [Acidobacteria bacterium]|jgi:tetratricopeptide (TPR) repeat protein|nr:tetratricopeptide repeat protein [Acidobacteriota bacterium]